MQYTSLAAAALCKQRAVLSCQTLLTWALGLLQADLGASALALALYSGSLLALLSIHHGACTHTCDV